MRASRHDYTEKVMITPRNGPQITRITRIAVWIVADARVLGAHAGVSTLPPGPPTELSYRPRCWLRSWPCASSRRRRRLVGLIFTELPIHRAELNHVPLRVDGIANGDTVE